MRPNDLGKRHRRNGGLANESANTHRADWMSARGTRYWSSGSIPLVAPDVLGDIIATASDLAVVISDTGQVLSVLINPTHRSFGSLDHWESRDIRDFLTSESIPKLDAQLDAFNAGEMPLRAMELNHSDRGDWEFPIRYTLHQIGPDGALLMLGRDLRPIAEMQEQLVNAQMALERDYEAQRDYDTRFRVLLDTVPSPIVFVAVDQGRITEVNGAAAALIGAAEDEIAESLFEQEFTWKRKTGLLDALANSAASNMSKPLEVTSKRSRKRVSITPRLFRAAGERFLLCALSGSEAAAPVADELTEALAGFFRDGIEGLVFTDLNGVVTAANDAFLTMADVAQASGAAGRPLSDFLSRGSIDSKVLIDNAIRSGRMSVYATRLVSEFGSERSVEISVTYLNDVSTPALVFVIRDTSRAETVRSSGINAADDGAKSVMELVGSASLKEIVADTTDVVEKMCIETAVRLTNNNRVAAAEMLGLSRQSLYVKLRKYDLLSRDPD